MLMREFGLLTGMLSLIKASQWQPNCKCRYAENNQIVESQP
jgi:hypothetical protein